MDEPIKPEGVRLVLADGTEVPLELEYAGVGLYPSSDGVYDAFHIWNSQPNPPPPLTRGSRLKAESLPPRTVVNVELEIDTGEPDANGGPGPTMPK
jgi:hypothetical protein